MMNEYMPLGELVIAVNGRMGNSVYYVRNGRICGRRFVIPSNPRTESQQRGRLRFARMVNRWKELDRTARKLWNERAKPLNMSGYNLFISHGMKGKKQLSQLHGRIKRHKACKRKALMVHGHSIGCYVFPNKTRSACLNSATWLSREKTHTLKNIIAASP